MVNSSWTRRHIQAIWWWQRAAPARVYPPCDTADLQALPLDRRLKRLYLLSVAQFRPEKDHAMQLRAFARARALATKMHSRAGDAVLSARLQLVGSCRGAGDERRVEALRGGLRPRGLNKCRRPGGSGGAGLDALLEQVCLVLLTLTSLPFWTPPVQRWPRSWVWRASWSSTSTCPSPRCARCWATRWRGCTRWWMNTLASASSSTWQRVSGALGRWAAAGRALGGRRQGSCHRI